MPPLDGAAQPRIETREQRIHPKEKITIHTNSPIFNPLDCGGGSIKQH